MIIPLYQRMLEVHQSPCSLLHDTQIDYISQLPLQLGGAMWQLQPMESDWKHCMPLLGLAYERKLSKANQMKQSKKQSKTNKQKMHSAQGLLCSFPFCLLDINTLGNLGIHTLKLTQPLSAQVPEWKHTAELLLTWTPGYCRAATEPSYTVGPFVNIQSLSHTYTFKKFIAYMKFRFNWAPCIFRCWTWQPYNKKNHI